MTHCMYESYVLEIFIDVQEMIGIEDIFCFISLCSGIKLTIVLFSLNL